MSSVRIDEIQLLTYKSTRFDDCFLIYSYDENQENVEIIAENIMEFTELVYDHHYLLVVRKEINRNVAIYLMAFKDDCQLESTIDAIDLLIDRKRQQLEDDSSRVPSSREIRIMKKIIEKKEDEYRKKIEEILKENAKKTSDLEQQIGEQTKKIEEYEKQLHERAQKKEEQEIIVENPERMKRKQLQLQELVTKPEDLEQKSKGQVHQIEEYKKQLEKMTKETQEQHKLIHRIFHEMEAGLHDSTEEQTKLQAKVEECENIIKEQEYKHHVYVRKTEDFERKIGEQTKTIEEYEKQLKKIPQNKEQITKQLFYPFTSLTSHINVFLNERNFETTKNSSLAIDGIANQLFKRETGQFKEPPLKEIHSLEGRRKEVIDFIEHSRINWNNPYTRTNIQKNIHDWLLSTRHRFLHNPSDKEKENSRKIFFNKFNLDNTIGTVHIVPIRFCDYSKYLCLAISNYRIVEWSFDSIAEFAFTDLYKNLKKEPRWLQNSKFATGMQLKDSYSDIFIHTSNQDVFVENEKVVTWMKNNFALEQKNNIWSFDPPLIPPLYNLIITFYDKSPDPLSHCITLNE